MASGTRIVFDPPLHRYHRSCHEQSYLQAHAVCSPFFKFMNSSLSICIRLSLKHIADGGSLVEEVIATVRTAQAFGSQTTLSGLYDFHVNQSRNIELRSAIYHGCGMAVFFFVIYSSYALS